MPSAEASPSLEGIVQPIGGKKADRAYEMLKRAIMLRFHTPETQLLEQSLATEFACSQSTVREALLRLAEDGLVERRGYRGTVVTDTSLAEATEMVLIRLSIERRAARALVSGGTPDLTPLEALTEEMDCSRRSGDLYRCSELDRTFHSQLARVAGLGLLSPILQRCALHIHRFTLGGVEVPRDYFSGAGIGQEHRLLLAAVRSGDISCAERAVSDHLASVLQRWAPSLFDAAGPDTFALG